MKKNTREKMTKLFVTLVVIMFVISLIPLLGR
ncbi:DNA-binding transcriptional regulator of glucitol operon [Clostridium algifaecis]|uniref:DNA-binding transcriptional regulator of glucitol operon n=1 Tax=Clostridium algifaecis TaxID=1472040 RepID=A0ABS4KNL9_9CLOT|nr:DUF4044 domain-containing protein [Clostridium algifaecis]MBP2031632.1 DNA-binding transcriptional regulator of glucitol operon [Clostridium algifaecis]